MKSAYSAHKLNQNQLHPLGDSVIVSDMVFDERITSSGIVILNDNGKSTGIRPRWGRVYAVGPKQKDVRVGQWIMIEHGRWTRGLDIEDESGERTIRKIDPDCIMLISDDKQCPDAEGVSTAVHVDKKTV